jgi:hypothetical protein
MMYVTRQYAESNPGLPVWEFQQCRIHLSFESDELETVGVPGSCLWDTLQISDVVNCKLQGILDRFIQTKFLVNINLIAGFWCRIRFLMTRMVSRGMCFPAMELE